MNYDANFESLRNDIVPCYVGTHQSTAQNFSGRSLNREIKHRPRFLKIRETRDQKNTTTRRAFNRAADVTVSRYYLCTLVAGTYKNQRRLRINGGEFAT